MAICSICGQEVHRYQVRFTVEGDPIVECLKHKSASSGYHPFKKYLDTNIAEKPVFIESDFQRERLMKEQNLTVRPREHIDDLNQRRWTKGLPPLRK